MITFITDDNKKGGSPSDDEPEIGFTEKGRSVGKIIEDAEAQKEAEENAKVEEKENNEDQSEASENNKPENAEVEKKIDQLVNSEGEKDAFVFALSLIPVQLRIGNIITRFPDGDSKVNRKPEYAYVEDGKIYVSSFD